MRYDFCNLPLEIESNLPDQLDLIDETITNTKVYRAQNSISAESFTITSTGDVTFEAGNEIRLKPGFSTETGSIFRADVDSDLINATTSISNRYDDSGSRVEKSLETGAKFTYIRDLNGQTFAVLDENGVELFYNIYGLDLIGQYDVAAGEEFYHLKDHLGNIRVTIDDDWNVLAYNDYYPFGMQMVGRTYNQGLTNDLYKYSSKELDEETGLDWYYFGARFYDPEVGRWYVPDPLSDKYPSLSPFSYVGNNPLIFIDANGTEWFYYQKEGDDEAKWHFHEDTKEKEIWTGEYDEKGKKKKELTKGEKGGFFAAEGDKWYFLGVKGGKAEATLLDVDIFGFTYLEIGGETYQVITNEMATDMLKMGISGGRGSVKISGKGLRKKPGKLGKFKGTNALRRENKMKREAAKKAGLDQNQARKLHREISGQNFSFKEILQTAKDIKAGKL